MSDIKWLLGVVILCATACSSSAGGGGGDGGGRKLTATEAACKMLREGDTPQFAYDVMVDILKDHSFEFPDPEAGARAAVQAAQAQGC